MIPRKMNWTNNKVLLEYTKYTPCKDIFVAICDELGNHYREKGFKYSRSKPKLTLDNDKIKLDITFYSSRSNIPGENITMEILPNFYSKQLKKDSKINGFLFGHTGIFYHKYLDDITRNRIINIYGDVHEQVDEYSHESKIIDSRYCNVYGIDEDKFHKIIKFIDEKIIPWQTKLLTEEGINELLENASPIRIDSLFGYNTNSDFRKYIELNFPNINLKDF